MTESRRPFGILTQETTLKVIPGDGAFEGFVDQDGKRYAEGDVIPAGTTLWGLYRTTLPTCRVV
jgi:hypothetical protein